MMSEIEIKPIALLPGAPGTAVCTSLDEFESRFFPIWYEKQKSAGDRVGGDSFGENLARFSAEKHLKSHPH
jgi:hypothetical protein